VILGRACLLLALLVSVYGAGVAVLGFARGRADLVASARRATYAVAALAAIAFGIVELAYRRDDFGYALVGGNSSTATPLLYKASAMWSSQAGSLLLWLLILSAQAALAVRIGGRRYPALAPVATAVLLLVAGFFCLLLVGFSSPFERLAPAPVDGNGLQPLLRYPLMAAHPVALYMGYAGFAVPFAFAVAALVTRRIDATWLVATRRFTLAAWSFLAVGLVLGARWSYAELGWGGYWGWDPVENAALLPWLTATALLHSSMVQEKRGMLKVWNVSLVMGTFVLALTGTFLVRSGILDSIHAFGASTLGVPFVVAIAVAVFASVGLVAWRRDDLRSEHRLDSLLSRETVFLLNNLVLVALAFVVLWGTFFPLISEAITGTKAAVGPPWFTRYVTPLGIVLGLLTGVGPLLAWRQTTLAGLARVVAAPAVAALGAALVAVMVTDALDHPTALVTFAVIAFTLAALGQEFWRGTRARRQATGGRWPVALAALVARNRRRYGGYIAHAGLAVLLLGVAASSSFATGVDAQLRPGQTIRIAGYELRYERPTTKLANEKLTFGTVVGVRRDGRTVSTLRPAREMYPSQDIEQLGPIGRFFGGEATSEIGLDASLGKDVWVAIQPNLSLLDATVRDANRRFANASPQVQALVIAAIVQRWANLTPPVNFRAFVRTGVSWLWIGAAILGFGALIAAWPSPRRRRAVSAARVAVAPATLR
jgi:cytochrome c-type biogenesis protein CcmF